MSIPKPKYIPDDFYHTVLKHIAQLERALSGNKNEIAGGFLSRINQDILSYYRNLISDDEILRDFYQINADNPEALQGVLDVFGMVAAWQYDDYKTSAKHDSEKATKLEKKLNECASLLGESHDLALNMQDFWDEYLLKCISGKEQVVETEYSHLVLTFKAMANHAAKLSVAAKTKSPLVNQLKAEDALIHLATRLLKRLFVEKKAPKHKHVRLIYVLIAGVMNENCDEERIRKLIR